MKKVLKKVLKKDQTVKKSNTIVIKGVPFDFTVHEGETLEGNIVFDTGGDKETFKFYADTWDDLLGGVLNHYELKKAVSPESQVMALWFEKVEQK